MANLKLVHRCVIASAFLFFTSCVKDIDLDQASEIVIPPKAAIDLVYFDLQIDNFHPQNTTGPKRVDDVVRLEFLDDDYIQDGLVKAELNFRYTNTFTSPVISEMTFLSENNASRYTIRFLIPGGSEEEPGIVDYTEIIEGNNLVDFKKAIKMRVQLEMLSGTSTDNGHLQLKSKAFLNLEY